MTDPGFIDEYMAEIEEKIAAHGWAVQGVGGDDEDPSFAYTVGLADQGRPELVMFGLPIQIMHGLLNDLARQDLPEPGSFISEVANLPLRLDAVVPEKAKEYLTIANRHAQRVVEAVQVVWPDREGLFPGDDGVDQEMMDKAQPLLGSA